MFSIHSCSVAVASIAVKERGRASTLKGTYCSHPLFIFIDSDAFGAYRLPFHGIERFAFDGVLAILCDRNIHFNMVFLNVQIPFERLGNAVYLTWHYCLTRIG